MLIGQFSSVAQLCLTLQPHGLQHTRLPCPSSTPGTYSNSGPSNRWCHPTISSSVVPSPPAFNLSQHQGLFQWVGSSHHMVAKVLEFQLQHQSFQWIFRTDFLRIAYWPFMFFLLWMPAYHLYLVALTLPPSLLSLFDLFYKGFKK